MMMDEQQAIQRLKKGDIGGLEFLVACHQMKAVRTAYLITRDASLAEDVVQDAFILAFRAIRGFDDTRPFEPWFMRSVVNASLKIMQKSARQIQVGVEIPGYKPASGGGGQDTCGCIQPAPVFWGASAGYYAVLPDAN